MSVGVVCKLERLGKGWRVVPAPKIPEVQDQLPVGFGIDPQKAMRDLAEQLEKKFKEQVLLILTQGGKKQ